MAKKISTTLRSFEEVDHALLELGRHEAKIQHDEAVLNDEIQKSRDAFDQKSNTARQKAQAIRSEVEAFCILNKDEFEKVRSRELIHGIVSFRTAPPNVALLNRKYNYKTVLELLKKLRLSKYIRTKEEVDKETILAASADKEISDEKLAAVGLKIDQSEVFAISIKWESLSN